MQNVARHTTALVKKQEQLGSTMFEFGVAFTLLANVSEVLATRFVSSTHTHTEREREARDGGGGGGGLLPRSGERGICSIFR